MTLLQTIVTSLLASSAVTGVSAFIGRIFIGNLTNHFFDRKIEAYRHQLNAISDGMRFDYERKTADFSLYIKTKHATCSKLYELLSIADGRLMTLQGFRSELTFEEFNKEDMSRHLRSHHIVEGKIEEILANWESDRNTSIQQARDYLHMIEFQEADKARVDAKNHLIVNALYISEKVEATTQALLSKMVEIQVALENPPEHGPGFMDEYKRTQEAIRLKDQLLLELKRLMRDELSVGASGYAQAPKSK